MFFKDISLITDPLNKNNPITVQILGICSALAVTTKISSSLVMSISVTVVLSIGSMIISCIRKIIPKQIRIIVQLVIISSLVIIVDQFITAYYFNISKQLSVFISLIITNCIIMGRFEAFALINTPWRSFLDGLGNGIGYGIILLIISFIREFLGSGSILGIKILGDSINKSLLYSTGYCNNGFMFLPPMALITIGTIIWIKNFNKKTNK